MNYYYFGFVLTAALIKLTGVVPGIAYNLAVPTFYALVAGGAFTAAAALAGRLRRAFAPPTAIDAAVAEAPVGASWRSTRALLFPGLLGAIFVAATGNLAEARLDLARLQGAGRRRRGDRVRRASRAGRKGSRAGSAANASRSRTTGGSGARAGPSSILRARRRRSPSSHSSRSCSPISTPT